MWSNQTFILGKPFQITHLKICTAVWSSFFTDGYLGYLKINPKAPKTHFQIGPFLVWKPAALTAHLGLFCPKETGVCLNFGLLRWSQPVRLFSLSVLCPSLYAPCHCPTLWTSPCHWCTLGRLCSVSDTLEGARLKMPSGPWFQTVPCNRT